MAEIVISVIGRFYTLHCADGHEENIRRLAQIVEAKASQFSHGSDMRRLLFAALTLADEKIEAQNMLATYQSSQSPTLAIQENTDPENSGDNAILAQQNFEFYTIAPTPCDDILAEPQALVEALDHIAERIEALARHYDGQ